MEAFKIVAPDDVYRAEVVRDMSGESLENQYEVKKIIWTAFWDLFNAQSALKSKEIIQQEKTVDFATALRRARQAIWVDFEDILSGKKAEKAQMEDIRLKLKELMSTVQPT